MNALTKELLKEDIKVGELYLAGSPDNRDPETDYNMGFGTSIVYIFEKSTDSAVTQEATTTDPAYAYKGVTVGVYPAKVILYTKRGATQNSPNFRNHTLVCKDQFCAKL